MAADLWAFRGVWKRTGTIPPVAVTATITKAVLSFRRGEALHALKGVGAPNLRAIFRAPPHIPESTQAHARMIILNNDTLFIGCVK